MYDVRELETRAQHEQSFEVMSQLRPHLSLADYLAAVEIQAREGYRLVASYDGGRIKAVAGFRVQHMLWRGRFLYVDDLVADEKSRSVGFGQALLDWLKAEAKKLGCASLQLDSGVQRHGAHRFYFREGLHVSGYHFVQELPR